MFHPGLSFPLFQEFYRRKCFAVNVWNKVVFSFFWFVFISLLCSSISFSTSTLVFLSSQFYVISTYFYISYTSYLPITYLFLLIFFTIYYESSAFTRFKQTACFAFAVLFRRKKRTSRKIASCSMTTQVTGSEKTWWSLSQVQNFAIWPYLEINISDLTVRESSLW